MQFLIMKDKFDDMENAFTRLKASESNQNACSKLADALSALTKKNINVCTISPTMKNQSCTVMSIYPHESTLDKIVAAVVNNDNDSVVAELWKSSSCWNIEIDTRILGSDVDLTEQELTALVLHEVGHVMDSDAIPNRIGRVVRYQVAKCNFVNKALLSDSFFSKVLIVPIMNACAFTREKSALKHEMRADAYVVKCGYGQYLNSAFTKVIAYAGTNVNPDREMAELTGFSIDTLINFQKRQNALVFKNFFALKNSTPSVYMKNAISRFTNVIKDPNQYKSSEFIERYNDDYIYGKMDKIISESHMSKMFVEGVFDNMIKMKRIDPSELDYIAIEVENIKTNDDKMIIISFIYSKLDTVDYYIRLMDSGDKKYYIPHTRPELENMKKRLETYRTIALNKKLPEIQYGLNISWPEGYEG